MKEKLSNISKSVKKSAGNVWQRIKKFMIRFPVWTLIIILALILVVAAVGNFIRKPKVDTTVVKPQPKQVQVYSIGEAPKMRAQAKVTKAGVIKIVAQSGGIVQKINVKEGDTVNRGTTLTSLASNYQGGNAATIQRQIAQKQYNNVVDTFDTQKDLIGKQRDQANKTDENSDKMRDISKQSIDETQSLLDLNNAILTAINSDLDQYTATNSGNVNKSAITALQSQKAGLLSSINALNQALRSTRYSTDGGNPPSQLSDITKEIVNKQLDIQEKALELNKEVSHLQYSLALVNEGAFYPAAPCAGVVEKVHVRFGEAVTPGTVLFTISTNEKSAMAIALVSKDVAFNVSKIEPSLIHSGGQTFSLLPSYVSTEATDGTLYSVYYALPDEFINSYGNESYLEVEIPIGYANTNASDPYIPLDAIHQTQDEAIVYVIQKGKAKAKVVQVDQVYGQFANVTSGLSGSDQIILNRDILDDEPVKVMNSK